MKNSTESKAAKTKNAKAHFTKLVLALSVLGLAALPTEVSRGGAGDVEATGAIGYGIGAPYYDPSGTISLTDFGTTSHAEVHTGQNTLSVTESSTQNSDGTVTYTSTAAGGYTEVTGNVGLITPGYYASILDIEALVYIPPNIPDYSVVGDPGSATDSQEAAVAIYVSDGTAAVHVQTNATFSAFGGVYWAAVLEGLTAYYDFDDTIECAKCDDSGCDVIDVPSDEDCPDGYTAQPVSYGSGAIRMTITPFRSMGFGRSWAPSMSFANQMGTVANSGPAGYNMVSRDLPYISSLGGGAKMHLVGSGTSHVSFDRNIKLDSSWETPASFGVRASMTMPANGSSSVFKSQQGSQVTFQPYDGTAPTGQAGQFKSAQDQYGNLTEVTSSDTSGHPADVDRSATIGGTQITERFHYDYATSGVNSGRLSAVTLRRRVGSGGSFVDVRKVEYTQYDGTESYGNQNDLKLLTVKDSSGNVLENYYYRYYQLGESNGYAHGLKYAFSPKSYERLKAWCTANSISNPDSATDSQVAVFADNYFEYDSQQRVTEEIAQGAGCSCSGSSGQGTYTYDRSTTNTSGTYTDDVNKWKQKTVETLPDDNVNIVFTNYLSQPMLKVHRIYSNPSDHTSSYTDYPEFYKYDSNSHAIWKVEPSAFIQSSGAYWDESKDDLLYFGTSDNSPYLADGAGLIHVYSYGTSTTATGSTAGDVIGYKKNEYVQHGETATPILVSSKAYKSNTDSNGNPVYPIGSLTLYRNTDGTGGETASFSYTWYSDTNAMKTRTTTKPTIGSTQNGPGAADVTTEYFDTFGHVIWSKNADGYITYTGYDAATGAIVKEVVDADTSQTGDFLSTDSVPSGLASLSGVSHLRLVSSYTIDALGRTTSTIDPRGDVTYTSYDDPDHEVRVYPGWNTSTNSPTGPTQVSREDRANNYTESFTMTATPSVTSGVPTGTESIASLQTLSRTYLDNSGRSDHSDRYFYLTGLTYSTSTSLGAVNTNFYTTTYGYDAMGRKDRMVDALGDITRTVYDGLGRVSSTWIGTYDTPSTGYWSPSNLAGTNLVKISENQYDGGSVGDSNLTQVTQFLDAAGTSIRISQMYYNWRNGLVATKSGVEGTEATTVHRPITICDLDNLGECTARYLYDGDGLTISVSSDGVASTSDSTKLRSKTETDCDDQGRAYQTIVYSVDQSSGTVSSTNKLTSNTWYDHRGNVIKTTSPGGLVSKAVFDGAGRTLTAYSSDGGGDSSWSDASTVSGDAILQEVDYTYNANSSPILTVSKSRNHLETATGALGNASTSPKARVEYSFAYFDLADRLIKNVSVGTNGGVPNGTGSSVTLVVDGTTGQVSPPTTEPTTSSDTVLISTTTYTDAGWINTVTDPKALVTKTYYDNAGRTLKTIEDNTDGTPTASTNRITEYTYDALDHTLTLKATMPSGTNSQTTQYVYGPITSTDVNSYSLLTTVKYPDKSSGSASTSASDQNSFTYDSLGEILTKTDQNGSIHTYSRDVLGRTTKDAITTLATGVNGDIRAIGLSFDTAGRPYQLTNYSDSSASTVVSQLQRAYNGFGQLTIEYQEHSSSGVNTSTSKKIQYAYTETTSGAVNNSRLTSVTYPNTRVVDYLYADIGDSSGLSDSISRITAIATSTTRGTHDANVIAAYDYLGLSSVVRKSYPIPGIRLDRTDGNTSTPSYSGLDNFDRLLTQQWTKYSPTTSPYANTSGGDVFHINHGYDRDSNRLYADNQTQPGAAHKYIYDNLNRLTSDKAGVIASDKSDIQSFWNPAKQAWALDPLGNPTSQDQVDAAPYETSTYNAQNQIVTHTVDANALSALANPFVNCSTWQEGGSGSFTVDPSTGLTVDTVDDAAYGAVALLPVGILGGSLEIKLYGYFPSGAPPGAEAGIVFGYTSSADYWLDVWNFDDQAEYIYHDVGGTKSLVSTGGGFLFSFGGNDVSTNESFNASLSGGFPTGQVGLWSNAPGVNFWNFSIVPHPTNKELGTQWLNDSSSITLGSGGLIKTDDVIPGAAYLRNLHLNKFQVTYGLQDPGEESGYVIGNLLFNASNTQNSEILNVYTADGSTPSIYSTASSHTDYPANAPTFDDSSQLWLRVAWDGSTLSVRAQANASEPSDSSWSAISPMYTATGFTSTSGMLGFNGAGDNNITSVVVKSYDSSTSSFDKTELNSFNNTTAHLSYDNNGNLTYDGNLSYTYDAWNRLKTVAHAYEDATTPYAIHAGQIFQTLTYDAAGRRIIKAITNIGSLDCTSHCYYSGNSIVEERNGSDQSIKDLVWGLSYVDEAIQTRINTTPSSTATWSSYWLCQDANFNVLGVVDSTGALVERYEYGAYGQRQVFTSSGTNDPGCYTPAFISQRVVTSGSVTQPYGLNELGHQGLMHDEESGLVYNRARMLNPILGRFMQEDALFYIDSANMYLYVMSNTLIGLDPLGLATLVIVTGGSGEAGLKSDDGHAGIIVNPRFLPGGTTPELLKQNYPSGRGVISFEPTHDPRAVSTDHDIGYYDWDKFKQCYDKSTPLYSFPIDKVHDAYVAMEAARDPSWSVGMNGNCTSQACKVLDLANQAGGTDSDKAYKLKGANTPRDVLSKLEYPAPSNVDHGTGASTKPPSCSCSRGSSGMAFLLSSFGFCVVLGLEKKKKRRISFLEFGSKS